MSYSKYFSKGQKVFLKRDYAEEKREALDSITAYATGGEREFLDLSLPYGSDAADVYPFEEGMMFELATDFNGMGLRLRASFVSKTGNKDIRLRFEENLEFISRRIYRRLDVNAWVGIERPAEGLAQMREAWQDCLQKIEAGVSAAELTQFKKYPVNLAGGGIRLPLQKMYNTPDLLLFFLSIGDKQGIICTLAEVVWTGKADQEGTVPTGMRFLNILERDQARIDAVVNNLLARMENR